MKLRYFCVQSQQIDRSSNELCYSNFVFGVNSFEKQEVQLQESMPVKILFPLLGNYSCYHLQWIGFSPVLPAGKQIALPANQTNMKES